MQNKNDLFQLLNFKLFSENLAQHKIIWMSFETIQHNIKGKVCPSNDMHWRILIHHIRSLKVFLARCNGGIENNASIERPGL